MKAVVVRKVGSAEESLRVETLPDPAPAPREAVIAVRACGVCAHDLATRSGVLKMGVRMPMTPGHEVAGEIVALGAEARGFRIGERVATTQRFHICGHCRYCRSAREPLCAEAVFMGDAGLNGGYAEFVRVETDNLASVPDGVSCEQAAIAACAIGTALHALREVARVRVGERVLVTGAGGGVGLHAVQLAKLSGAYVVAQTTSANKTERLRQAGADAVVACARGEDFSAAVRDACSGGVDVVIDTVGSPQYQPTRRALAPGARWTMVGQVTGDFTPFNPAQLFLRGISLLSSTSTTRAELEDVLDLIARGAVRPEVDGVYRLEDAALAHRALEQGRVTGRLVLAPASCSHKETTT